MLGKLIKHEWRQCLHYFIPLYIGTSIATIVTALLMAANEIVLSEITFMFQLFAIVLYFISSFSLALGSYGLLVFRFYRNMVSEEGYLTHTLPVSMNQLLLSKLIVSIFFTIISWLGIILMYVMAFSSKPEILTHTISYANTVITETFSTANAGNAIYFFLLSSCLNHIASMMIAYMSISLGQCMRSNKVIWSIVFYACSSIIIGIISLIVNSPIAGSQSVSASSSRIYTELFISVIEIIAFYFITKYLLSKKLNLE